MIETTLRATSEKLKPGACSTLRRPAQLVGAELREEALDRARGLRGVRRSPRAASRPSDSMTSVWLASSKRVRSRASRSLRISMR